MRYEEHLRTLFRGAELEVEDLYLLEPYQIAYLEERAAKRNLSAVLRLQPALGTFFRRKCPQIARFLDEVQGLDPTGNDEELARLADSLVWEVADMLVYCKSPELYDERRRSGWNIGDFTRTLSIEDEVVIDAGAGTGLITFEVASRARHVFAVEPNPNLRRFIRDRADERAIHNVFAIDGFLDAIPLPEGFADTLITLNAIGWRLDEELAEIERVVKPGGRAAHLTGLSVDRDDGPIGRVLTSGDWRYEPASYDDREGPKRMYVKKVR